MHRRHFLLGTATLAFSFPAKAQSYDDILVRASGQRVFWNAWAGDERTNAFIAWVGQETQKRYGVAIEHVPLRDTSEAVTRVIAEKQAGRDTGGTVDLIWINGQNFFSMKEQRLLHGPFAQNLPNWRYVDTVHKPSNVVDFTIPVEGYAAPWRLAQVIFVYDSARTAPADLPPAMRDFVPFAQSRPGRVTHPHGRNFLGATFLKQALVELAPDPAVLAKPATDTAFQAATAPLWAWYGALRPHLWRQGLEFPETGPAQRQMLADGEIDLAISFSPAEAAIGIANKLLPGTARSHTLAGGSIGNTSFVAIPYNAANKEGAMLVADFLLDPATQARAQDPRQLGEFTVLDLEKLDPTQRQAFQDLAQDPALPSNAELGQVLAEPHPSWMARITQAWERLVQQ